MPRPTISGSGMPDRDSVDVGADLLVHAENGGVSIGADEEARRDDGAVVLGLRVDVLDAVDALDDGLERLGDELRRRPPPCSPLAATMDVDHRHGNLRLLLARQRDQRHKPERKGRQQEQRRQRRSDEGAGEIAGKSELHGSMIRSPSCRPVRISVRFRPSSSTASPRMTATSISPAGVAMRT